MTLNQLPTEVLEKVLGYLPWYCLPEKALVCQKWFVIIRKWLKRLHNSPLILNVIHETYEIKCTLKPSRQPITVGMQFDRSAHLRKLKLANITHGDVVELLTSFCHQLEFLEQLEIDIYRGDTSVGVGPAYIALPNLRVLRFEAHRKQRETLWRLAWMYVFKAPKLQEKHILENSYKRLLFLFVDEPVRNRGRLARLRSNCTVMMNYLWIVLLYLLWQ